ncbi:MAG: hypothetical protein V7636_457, partial [Actinomycetota bacterium]
DEDPAVRAEIAAVPPPRADVAAVAVQVSTPR